MYQLYRVVVPGSETLLAATSVEFVKSLAATLAPGKYVIEEVTVDDRQGKESRRRWGIAAWDGHGKVSLQRSDEPMHPACHELAKAWRMGGVSLPLVFSLRGSESVSLCSS